MLLGVCGCGCGNCFFFPAVVGSDFGQNFGKEVARVSEGGGW